MIGISELLLIAALIIILFKPNDYSEIIKSLVSFFRRGQGMVSEVKSLILSDEIKKELEDVRDNIVVLNGKKYIYGDDDKLHEVFDLEEFKKENQNINKNS